MDARQAIVELKALRDNTDQEEAHIEADHILCELLISLGHIEVVEQYNRIPKWFA